MDNYTLPELIWSVAMLLWPICILCLAILFKKDISFFIRSRYSPNKEKTDSRISNKIDKKTNGSKQPEIKRQNEDEYIPVEVCKNLCSGEYFIVLEDQIDAKVRLIIPSGDIKLLELSLFDEIEEQNLLKFLKNGNLTKEQLFTYEKFLSDGLDKSIDAFLKNQNTSLKEESPYIGKYRKMLLNGNTIPARMLEFVKKSQKATWVEIKNHLTNIYGYTDSGSYSASLRVLLIDDYIIVKGQGDNKTIFFKNRVKP